MRLFVVVFALLSLFARAAPEETGSGRGGEEADRAEEAAAAKQSLLDEVEDAVESEDEREVKEDFPRDSLQKNGLRTPEELLADASRIAGLLEKERESVQAEVERVDDAIRGGKLKPVELERAQKELAGLMVKQKSIDDDIRRTDKAKEDVKRIQGADTSGVAREAAELDAEREVYSDQREVEAEEDRWRHTRSSADEKEALADASHEELLKKIRAANGDNKKAMVKVFEILKAQASEFQKMQKAAESYKRQMDEVEEEIVREMKLLAKDKDELQQLIGESSIVANALRENARSHDVERVELNRLKTAVYGELIVGATVILGLIATLAFKAYSVVGGAGAKAKGAGAAVERGGYQSVSTSEMPLEGVADGPEDDGLGVEDNDLERGPWT